METTYPKTMCEKHENRTGDILCLDDNHEESSVGCIKCILDNHKGCQIEKIFLFKEMERNIIIDTKHRNYDPLKKCLFKIIKKGRISCAIHYYKLEQYEIENTNKKLYRLSCERNKDPDEFDRKVDLLKTKLSKTKEEIACLVKKANEQYDRLAEEIETILSPISLKDLIVSSKLKTIQRNSDIEIRESDNKVVITPFMNKRDKNEALRIIKLFKASLKKYDILDRLHFIFYEIPWIGHNDLYIEQSAKEVWIELRDKQSAKEVWIKIRDLNKWRLGCVVKYKYPLQSHCKFKITIKRINKDWRSIGLGIVSEEGFDKFGNLNFKGHLIVYDGHDVHNLSGIHPADGIYCPLGHAEGKVYFIEFWPGDRIVIVSENKKVNLWSSVEDKTYYLIARFFYLPSAIVVERLF